MKSAEISAAVMLLHEASASAEQVNAIARGLKWAIADGKAA